MTKAPEWTWGIALVWGVAAGIASAAPLPPATSLNNCQHAVNVASKQFISSKLSALSPCLQAVSTQIVQKGASNATAAAGPCVGAFRKISDSRGLGKQLSDKLSAAIEKKCAPGQPKVTHTLADILGGGTGVAQPLNAANLNAWCARFGGDGSIDSVQEWIDCVTAVAECSVDAALASQYPRVLDWLNVVRPAIQALSPPASDPTKISDALAALDAVKAEIDGPDNDNVISIQCFGPAPTPVPTNTPIPTATPGGCLELGGACAVAADCCNGVCTGSVCEYPACTSDGQTCSSNAACCGGTCSGGTCAALNVTCRTLGNACTQNGDCCSSLCQNGTCAVSSYCTQNGDVCAAASDCCSGACSIAAGATRGTCTALTSSAACTGIDGTVCSGALPCGANCCSGLCAPYGPTGVAICQPASGCHATGDLCTRDADCCGSAGLPGAASTPVTCSIAQGATVGVCRNPQGCAPDGNLCKLSTSSCNRSCDCCSGNCELEDTCTPDLTGIPRCAGSVCVAPGGSCASSANCCNGNPCVPNPGGTPSFVCLSSTCAAAGQGCGIDGDCCAGLRCADNPNGTPAMVCVSSSSTCAAMGQGCSSNADCCDGVPCSLDSSSCPAAGQGCRCYFAVQ